MPLASYCIVLWSLDGLRASPKNRNRNTALGISGLGSRMKSTVVSGVATGRVSEFAKPGWYVCASIHDGVRRIEHIRSGDSYSLEGGEGGR